MCCTLRKNTGCHFSLMFTAPTGARPSQPDHSWYVLPAPKQALGNPAALRPLSLDTDPPTALFERAHQFTVLCLAYDSVLSPRTATHIGGGALNQMVGRVAS